MPTKTKKKQTMKIPQVVYRNNKPVSVILDIEEYQEILERLDDIEDLEFIEQLKNKSLTFRKLDYFLVDYNRSNV